MCPSFRVTRAERDLTRGRANSLRLAMSGQLGRGALTSAAMYETMALCVSCKGCRRECPTGVDMARMKIEFLNQYHQVVPHTRRELLVAHLPRYAAWIAQLAPLLGLARTFPALRRFAARLIGFAGARSLPQWHARGQARLRKLAREHADSAASEREVVLLPNTFDTWFEPQVLADAAAVLRKAGYRVAVATPKRGRPLCCGRTYLASGMIEEAREEAARTLAFLAPYAHRGIPIIGTEPSCLFGFRDEIPGMLANEDSAAVQAQTVTLAQFIASEQAAGNWQLPFSPVPFKRVLVHGHCHEKAFDAFGDVLSVLRSVPELEVEEVVSSCCGMAGAFGYADEHYEVSMKMAEASLLPAVRAAAQDTVIVADGTSCRHQVADGTGRRSVHIASVLAAACSGALGGN